MTQAALFKKSTQVGKSHCGDNFDADALLNPVVALFFFRQMCIICFSSQHLSCSSLANHVLVLGGQILHSILDDSFRSYSKN